MQERYKEMNVITLERQDRIRYRRDLLLQESRTRMAVVASGAEN
ncbi:hypothetical protein ACTHRH_13460 [Paenibacillus sp. SAFN-117]|nr:hypothetical protein [Paenibacillus sp. 32O-W]